MKRPKILITGGLGFIFSYVTEYFVKKGWNVVVIDNQSAGSHPEIIDGTFVYYNLDVSDKSVISLIHKEAPQYVVHAAAISDVDYSIKHPYKTIKSNTLASLNIYEACRNLSSLKKFVYVSTDEVYGECRHKKVEDEIIFPKNPYSSSKAIGSLLRIAYDNTYLEFKNKTAETRFCNVFGHRQESTKIIAAIKKSIDKKQPISLQNGGKGYREYIYVKNIPPIIELILKKGSRTYNVTLNDGFTVKKLIQRIEKLTGKKVFTRKSKRQGMDIKYQMDNKRIFKLGWRSLYTFDEGLREYFLGESAIIKK